MVSIPDWTKFARSTEGPQDRQALVNKYYRQREEDAVRQAEERGYFLDPSKLYLIRTCGPANGRKVRDCLKLRLIRLVNVHLRKIGDISLCENLQICNLSKNFLMKIDPLAACRNLVKLDLHSNQLAMLPGITFWSSMRKLKVLNLHDNPLGKYEILQSLATCSAIVALTLHDTPISLKKNYRHHVVNSIWSLKALDFHVISDEEIIEDATLGGKFGTLSHHFKINLCPSMSEACNCEEGLNEVKALERNINKILAHYSPVVIIQRYMRGYIVRKEHMHNRNPAMMKMAKLSMQYDSLTVTAPPPSTPNTLPIQSEKDSESLPDIKKHGAMSADPPDSPITIPRASIDMSVFHEPHPSPTTNSLSSSPDGAQRKKKNLTINLAKLQNGTFQSLFDEAIAIETVLPDQSEDFIPRIESRRKYRKKKRQDSKKDKRCITTAKQFFGPVVENSATEDNSDTLLPDIDSELPITQFRLQGLRPRVRLVDPMTEMILERRILGRYIRDAETEHHKNIQEQPVPKVTQNKNMNTDQRIFARVHGTMGLSCLYAVHRAYKDRERAERSAEKMEHVLSLKEDRDRAKERIKLYKDEKRNIVMKQHDRDRSRIIDAIERKEFQRLNYLDKRNGVNSKSSDMTRGYRTDFGFVTEFNTQHTSVSNALLRHDRQAKLEDVHTSRSDHVNCLKTVEGEQQRTVKKYLEHRVLMRQTESAMARATLDTRMLQEANDRVIEAKSRVAQQKARKDTVKAFYPLPNSTTLPSGSPSGTQMSGMASWEANVSATHGRIGRHPTLVT